VGPNFYSLYFSTPSSSYFTKWVEYGLMDSTLGHANFGSLHTTGFTHRSSVYREIKKNRFANTLKRFIGQELRILKVNHQHFFIFSSAF